MSPADLVARWAQFYTRDVASVHADLESYAALLRKWQGIKNLVSRETFSELWERHIADSLQLARFIREPEVLDLGSGGGFPAFPIAIARKDATHVTCVEPNSRKASFLRTVARELGLDLTVLGQRSTEIDSRETPLVTARALAPLTELCGLAAPFFGVNTRALFHKGREYGEEIAAARLSWQFDVVVHPSEVDVAGVLLEIRNLTAASKV